MVRLANRTESRPSVAPYVFTDTKGDRRGCSRARYATRPGYRRTNLRSLSQERINLAGVRDFFREDDHRPRALTAGLPSEALALVGCVATEASLIEQIVDSGLLELSGLSDEEAQSAYRDLGFSRKWEQCRRLARDSDGPVAEFLRAWLPRARDVMRVRNQVIHSYWHTSLERESLFYAYGGPLRGPSLLANADDLRGVVAEIREVHQEGWRLRAWIKGVITADELLGLAEAPKPSVP